MRTMDFNFHNILKLRIRMEDRPFLQFLSHTDMEYDYFRSKVSNPDVVIVVGKFKPRNSECNLIDHKYYVKKDYIFFEDSYKFAKWKAEITGFESGRITARIESNPFGYWFFVGYIIESLIRYKMLQKGYVLLHAGGVAKNKKAIVFPARGSAGKTTVALHFMDKGYEFFGDDYVILNKQTVLPYPSFLHVFNYHMTRMPTYQENLSPKEKAEIKMKYLLYKASGGYAKFFTYLKFKDVFPNAKIGNSAKLNNIVFIIKSVGKKLSIRRISKEEAVKRMVYNMKIETHPFVHYMESYAYVFPNSKFARHWEFLEETLKKSINCPCSILEVSDYNPVTMQKILRQFKAM